LILVSRNNVIKKVAIIFFIILSFTQFSNVKADIVSPTTNFYVNDYANVLSSTTEKHIMNMNVELQKKTGAQVVVVTIDTLNGQSIETYATKLFREFGIGDKTKNNGLLLLLVVNDRESRIEVGFGLEGALPDGKTGRIQDEYMIPYYKNNNWNDGIKNGFDACLSVIQDEYNIQLEGLNYLEVGDESTASIDMIQIIETIFIIFSIILFIKTGGRSGLYLGGISSGRSSGHSSFRGFSGGGGRSGGGGSSRKF